ncbi:MAG: aconitate hydratase [Deltaproteobacteria bacterium]|nr:aconitate hydratase [Deltaproteobacteria bacterium]
MAKNIVQKIISTHLMSGTMLPDQDIALKIDQTLTQDATGTMAYLQFEAMGVDRVRTDLSVSYVDHNTLQMGFRNSDDHRFLKSVATRFGIVFSPPGTGICHQLHLENFAKPGTTLIGSDSHTPTAGGIGAMAMGAGGLSVAMAMAGEPYIIPMPKIFLVHLSGRLRGHATAKDIILTLLGLLSVKGGVGIAFEYGGPGVANLSVPERATITNMGAELGATTSIFPSDARTRDFLAAMGRENDFMPIAADKESQYDRIIDLNLDDIVPMAACPHMPDKVKPIRELSGLAVQQVCVGSCTNSSYLDLCQVAAILENRAINPGTEMLIAPGSKQVLTMLLREGKVESLLDAGGRLLECACGPCIGMGGSPSSGGVSVRTFNRNFEGRSGTQDAQVFLTSPVTAAHCALDGMFTDPAHWKPEPIRVDLPAQPPSIRHHFVFPLQDGNTAEILRGPNIAPLPDFAPLPEMLEVSVAIRLDDDITTDHILPGGAEVTALRSNVPAISVHVFSRISPGFADRCRAMGQCIIVAGQNYGQGSSREHAALAPRYLGVKAVLAKSFARIHKANLINFGIIPLTFSGPKDFEIIEPGDRISISTSGLSGSTKLRAVVENKGEITVNHDLTAEQLQTIQAGGLLNQIRDKVASR